MKKLKIFSLVIMATLIFSSCSSDNENDESGAEADLNLTAQRTDSQINTAALPQAILDYISSNYPENTITEAEREDNNSYEVELNNGIELIFDQEGNFLGIDDDDENDFGDKEISVGDLPAAIRDFISTYFPGTNIEEAEKENNGNFEIELSNDVEIIFDADGNFLGRADDDDNDDIDDEDIEISELPQAILDYIASNYPENTIIEAEIENDSTYEVTLNNGVELKFDAAGNFLEAEDHNGDDDDEENESDD